MTSTQLIGRIDATVERHAMLAHPFYQKWTCGELELDTLREYAKQYYAFEQAFPTWLSAVHSQIEESADRKVVLENLIDEERGDDNHQELWLRFAESLGVKRNDVLDADLLPTTEKLLVRFESAATQGPATGLAALYSYESQASEIAKTKMAGLAEHYGISEGPGLEFFRVHENMDVWHADAERDLIERLSESDERTHAAASQGAVGLWEFLDGVDAAYT